VSFGRVHAGWSVARVHARVRKVLRRPLARTFVQRRLFGVWSVSLEETALPKKQNKKNEKENKEGKKRDYSVIFYHSEEQKRIAVEEVSKEDRELHAHNIIMGHVRTDVEQAKHVYPADKEDQQFFLQRDKFLLKTVNCSTSEELQFSHFACKLNGFCSELATKEDVETAMTDLILHDDVAAYLRTKIKLRRNSQSQ